jgi:outer membrane protein assembly factor BamA
MTILRFKSMPFYLAIIVILFAGLSSNVYAENSSAEPDSLKKSSFTVLPFAFYSPETKFAFGIFPNYIFRTSPSSRPSSISLPGYYSTKKQISVTLRPLLYLKDEKYFIDAAIAFSKWPEYYFGIGPDTREEDREKYTVRNFRIDLAGGQKFRNNIYLGLSFRYYYQKFLETETDGALATQTITGSMDGDLFGGGFLVLLDTRDNIFFPTRGFLGKAEFKIYGTDLIGDYTYYRFNVDLRNFREISANQVIAAHACFDLVTEGAPFIVYPRLGDIVRGYYPTRYTGQNLIAFEAEYRFHPIFWRFGLAGFAGAGTVSESLSGLRDTTLRFAAGLGLRFQLVPEEKLSVRFDLGFGDESAEFYMSIDEAF